MKYYWDPCWEIKLNYVVIFGFGTSIPHIMMQRYSASLSICFMCAEILHDCIFFVLLHCHGFFFLFFFPPWRGWECGICDWILWAGEWMMVTTGALFSHVLPNSICLIIVLKIRYSKYHITGPNNLSCTFILSRYAFFQVLHNREG